MGVVAGSAADGSAVVVSEALMCRMAARCALSGLQKT